MKGVLSTHSTGGGERWGYKNEPKDNESVHTYQEERRDSLQIIIEVILPLMSQYGVLGTEYFGFEILRRVRVETPPIKG